MKKRAIASLLVLSILCCIFLVSCDDSTMDDKYASFLSKYSEEQKVENNKNALEDYIEAYENTEGLDSYSMKVDISLKYGNVISTKVVAKGTIKYENSNYDGKASVEFANVSLLEFEYKSDNKDNAIVVDDEIGNIEVPVNFAAIGGVIYLNIIDGDTSDNNVTLKTATLVYDSPETVKFTISRKDTDKYYPGFSDIQKFLDEIEVPIISFEDTVFNDTIVYATIENNMISSCEVILSGTTNNVNFSASLKGTLTV